MREEIAKLHALQQLEFGTSARGAASRAAALRREIAPDLLAKYDRLATRGKKPVAVVQNGVCSQCHIQLAVGALFALSQPSSPGICGNCGRLLHLPEAPKNSAAAVS